VLYLTTGTPGAGKTLWTIYTVEKRRRAENRPVYYYNIKGLTLDWNELTLEQVMRWWELPSGSIIVIDEAQDVFPKGSSTQKPPEHADRIAKHRHGGFDIYLVSQHPMKLDANVRKDVEEHRHLMRKFGTSWVTIHLWKGVRDNCDKTRKDSIPTQWKHPREVFDWYKSAEVHTVKMSVPWQVWLILAIPVFIGFATWWIFWGREARYEKPPAGAAAAAPGGGSQKQTSRVAGGEPARRIAPQTAQEIAESFAPRVAGLPFTAPRYDELTAPVRVPVVVGCWQTESKKDGWCFTQQGTKVRLDQTQIAAFIEAGGFFQDFDAGPRVGEESGRKDSSTASKTGPQSGV